MMFIVLKKKAQEEAITVYYMYTRRPDFGPKLAKNANAIVRWKGKGALAIPKGRCLTTYFPFFVTKAVFTFWDAPTGIRWKAY